MRDLRILLTETEADIYLFSGDILYRAFYDEEKIFRFVTLQEELVELSRLSPPIAEGRVYPFDLAQDILRFPEKYGNDPGLLRTASEYRALFDKALKTMREKYELIAELIEKYSNAECRVLPGNYDLDFRYTALEGRSLHRKQLHFGGHILGGYGGAPVATSGIPEKLAVVYHEYSDGRGLYSEPENFFHESGADIVLIHNPSFGYFDLAHGIGHVGSMGVRNYVDDNAPRLVLSGHVHEDYGISMRKNGTILLNPSNFGGVDSIYGYQEGGPFVEIFFEGTRIKEVALRRLKDDHIYDLMNISCDPEGLRGEIKSDGREHSHLDLNDFIRDANGNKQS